MNKIEIPLCRPDICDDEKNIVLDVLSSGWLAHGPKNKDFEKEFAKYVGSSHAVSVNSCASALHLAILASDLKGEIILPTFTFSASANAIITAGCKPVFVDSLYDTCNIDPAKIRSAITKNTVAIMPVHYAGQVCQMDEIMKIAKEHNLVVIEDSAECIGGTYKGKIAGSFGIGCFSFYPTKNITTGEGGMITTNDKTLAEKSAGIRAHGIVSSTYERESELMPWMRSASYPGYNMRMCDILAAIGLVQIRKINTLNDKRRKHSAFLSKELLKIPEIVIPVEDKNCKHVYQMYTIKIKEDSRINRNKFILALRQKGIGASVHFEPPCHLQTAYRGFGYKEGMFPVAEKLAKSIVTIPMFPGLSAEELRYIVNTIKETIIELR